MTVRNRVIFITKTVKSTADLVRLSNCNLNIVYRTPQVAEDNVKT